MKVSAGPLAPRKPVVERPETLDQTTEAQELQLQQEVTPHSMAAKLLALSASSPQPGQTRTSQLHAQLAERRKAGLRTDEERKKSGAEEPIHQTSAQAQSQFSAHMALPKSVSPARSPSKSVQKEKELNVQQLAQQKIVQVKKQIQMQQKYLEKLRATVAVQEKQIQSQTEELGKLREDVEQQVRVNSQLQNKFFRDQVRAKTRSAQDQKPFCSAKELDDKFILMQSEYSIYQKQLSQQFRENAELKSNLEKAKRTEETLKKDIAKIQEKIQQYTAEREQGHKDNTGDELVTLIAEGELEECINLALLLLADSKESV